DFHPIHIFLNSSSISDYEEFKRLGISKDEDKLREYRNSHTRRDGIRHTFLSLLDYLKENSDEILISTCQEINNHFRRNLEVDISVDEEQVSVSGCFEGLTLLFPFVDDMELDKMSETLARAVPIEVGGIRCLLAQLSLSASKDGRINIPRECLGT
ncbi:MAG: hypothetical protein ACE5KV_08740, partial [Thermoplasmata archaeon]